LLTSIALAIVCVSGCKEEPARVAQPVSEKPPEEMTAAERDRLDAKTAKQEVADFRLAVYYHLDRWRFTGVILSVGPAKVPDADSGAVGITVVRLTVEEAGRLIDRLSAGGYLRRAWDRANMFGGRPDLPYYTIAGNAGRPGHFLDLAGAGPDVRLRLAGFAEALAGESKKALRPFIQVDYDQPVARKVSSLPYGGG
jgi:hypothetical protein